MNFDKYGKGDLFHVKMKDLEFLNGPNVKT